MKQIITFLIVLLIAQLLFPQTTQVPSYYMIDEKLSNDLNNIVLDLELEQNFDVGEDGIE